MTFSIHQVPGRIRLRSPRLKKETAEAWFVAHTLRQWEGVYRAETNPVTGSMTIRFDPGLTSALRILDFLSENGYFPPLHRSTPAQTDFRRLEFSLSQEGLNFRKIFTRVVKEVVQSYGIGLFLAIF